MTHHVKIEGMRFAPERIEVGVGDRVAWINQDFLPHSVTSAQAGVESGDLAQGGRWSLAAREKGEIRYICRLHPTMKGVVVVK